MSEIRNPVVQQLLEKYELIWALGYMGHISAWDIETYMPEGAAALRGDAHAQLSAHIQQLILDPSFVSLVHSLEKEQLTDVERWIYRTLKKDIEYYTKIPESFIKTWSSLTNEASVVWRNARKDNNFSLFAPYLEKIVTMAQEKATYLGYVDHPYDALLDLYEEGLTTKMVDTYFSELRWPLQTILAKVKARFTENNGIETLEYDKDKLQTLNQQILDYLWFDANRMRLDLTTHPFCSGQTNHDVRITTRFEKHFHNTIFGSIHEYGHALYELGHTDELNKTPIRWGHSLVVHESQSRFWENLVGRSRTFTELFIKGYQALGKGFESYTVDQYDQYMNHVQPGLIRVDGDELTYHFHIMIRFEIEKSLMDDSLKVADLPAYRNKMYKEYLGIDVPNDAVGVLQDVHWSSGLIGYFPTYSMGTALSVMRKDTMEKELGTIECLVGSKEWISKIREWLRLHIHQYGSTYTLNELLEKNGLSFSPAPLLAYLEKKFC